MLNRHIVVLASALLLAATLPASAQSEHVVTEVQAGDPDANRAAESAGADVLLVYVDADNDGNVDARDPDETIYLSLGNDQFVSFGDIRLTGFLTYPAGTAVNYTNRDVDLFTEQVPGWFAQDPEGAWYVDVDDNDRISVGDLRIRSETGITKVGSDDPALGTRLEQVHQPTTGSQRFIYIDEGRDGLDWRDKLYLDLDANDQINIGELRFQASHLGIDDSPTGREFRQALEELYGTDVQLRQDLMKGEQGTESRIDALEDELAATQGDLAETQSALAQARADLETKDTWLLILGVVDLLAIAGVGYWVYQGKQGAAEDQGEGL